MDPTHSSSGNAISRRSAVNKHVFASLKNHHSSIEVLLSWKTATQREQCSAPSIPANTKKQADDSRPTKKGASGRLALRAAGSGS